MSAQHTKSKPWEHAKGSGSETDPLAARFVESLSYDTRLYDADIRGSVAHARMLQGVGLLTSPELASIEQGLGEIRREIESAPAGPTAVGVPGAWPGWRVELEDVHMCIEAALIEKIGDAGRKLHTGRSRNDQVALDLRIWLREAAEQTAGLLGRCMESLAGLSAKQGGIVMPSYTHLQRAQPIRLSGELLAWHTMLDSDRRLMGRLVERGGEESPLGSGAAAGSTLPLDRNAAAAMLGFEGAGASSIEATASRDDALDYLYGLARVAMHLSRWAEQWILYCTTEFSFLRLAEAHTTGSSMMPQKRNPDMLELIRGRCGGVYGHLTALLTICKGLPIAYNRDLQEDKRHVFAAHDTVGDCLEMAARIIAGAVFQGDRIAPTLGRGYLDATVLAEYLVSQPRGVPFRTAHQIVGALVRACEASGRESLSQMTVEEFNRALRDHGVTGARVGADVFDWLGAENAVKRYRTVGHGGSAIGGLGGGVGVIEAAPERSSEPVGESAGDGAKQGGASSAGSLFGGGEATDPSGENGGADRHTAVLIEAYGEVGRTLDDLPYTGEFDQLYEKVRAMGSPTKRAVFHKLQNLRKSGRLPKVGRAASSPPRISEEEERMLRGLVEEALPGGIGARDQLPFTEAFDRLVEGFNVQTGRSLDPHSVWRLVAKLAK